MLWLLCMVVVLCCIDVGVVSVIAIVLPTSLLSLVTSLSLLLIGVVSVIVVVSLLSLLL